MESVKYKICYWYHEYQDMSASVPTCDYYRQYGECPCEPECEHFITKKEVDDIRRALKAKQKITDKQVLGHLQRSKMPTMQRIYQKIK